MQNVVQQLRAGHLGRCETKSRAFVLSFHVSAFGFCPRYAYAYATRTTKAVPWNSCSAMVLTRPTHFQAAVRGRGQGLSSFDPFCTLCNGSDGGNNYVRG